MDGFKSVLWVLTPVVVLGLAGSLLWTTLDQQAQLNTLASVVADLQEQDRYDVADKRIGEALIRQCLDGIEEQQVEIEHLWDKAGGRPRNLPYGHGWEVVPQRQPTPTEPTPTEPTPTEPTPAEPTPAEPRRTATEEPARRLPVGYSAPTGEAVPLSSVPVGARFRFLAPYDERVWISEGRGSGAMRSVWYVYMEGTHEGTVVDADEPVHVLPSRPQAQPQPLPEQPEQPEQDKYGGDEDYNWDDIAPA